MNEGDYKTMSDADHAEAEREVDKPAPNSKTWGAELSTFTIEFYDTFQGQSHVDGRFIDQAAALEWAEAHLLKDAIAYLR